MQVIDYLYKLADVGDKNFWDSFNYNFNRLATHNHDGINSAKLAGNSHAPTIQTLTNTATPTTWVASGAEYRYEMLFPVAWGMTFPNAGEYNSEFLVQVFDANSRLVDLNWGPNPAGSGIYLYSKVVPSEVLYASIY
jgi:hypothetical protein